ncbi:MAG TPA: DNA starvation/stationary phase protection protein Dps [Gemmatimonadales bacterium]|jgi:starvation-inducible DNA-binding protein|nr:DNA starvation/stationary phase protection protein Dps [Gemmatimonadales bacterium]
MARTTTQRGNGGKSRKRAATTPARPRVTEAAAPPSADTKLFATKNDLPEDKRVEVIGLLNQRLAEAIDLQTQCKQAHWNVKGPSFIALHKLFDDVNEDVENYVDLIAERVVQLGGVAEGTIGAAQQRSKLPDYPIGIATGPEHVAALSDALGAFGRAARIAIEEMNELEDADSADVLTEISRGVDKWLWFVEAHQQA